MCHTRWNCNFVMKTRQIINDYSSQGFASFIIIFDRLKHQSENHWKIFHQNYYKLL